MKKSALTIAGSDSSGGAGIQADLRAFNAAGVHGACAITCVTAQNTRSVRAIHRLPLNIIEKQIDAIVDDLAPTAAKTGMLYDTSTVKLVSKKIKEHNLAVVVDPVMIATVGHPLIRAEYLGNIALKESIDVRYHEYIGALKRDLIPKAEIVTPNLFEASRIVGWSVDTLEDMKKACETISHLGCEYVLITGGHLKDSATDVLYHPKKGYEFFEAPKAHIGKIHGSGCFYSAYITALLAKGLDVETSVKRAKNFINDSIKAGYKIGKGNVRVLRLQ